MKPHTEEDGMAMKPTQEQQAAREVFVAGRDLALVAGAGTGKTSTLMLMGSATKRRGLYISFNRAIADDARGRFGRNVECRTAHSLAFKAVGRNYGPRLEASARIPAKQTARLLGITSDLMVNGTKITIAHQARLVMGMVRRFCYTTDRQVMARHMERLNGLNVEGQDFAARTLLPYAVRAWEDIQAYEGRLRFEHDFYMKMWAMGAPVLPADFVLLDEAQDTNPVLEEVFLNQPAQRICVGDPAQQIYGWRSAKDVMTGFPAEHLHLTQSFRFGPRISEEANRWLQHAESDLRLTGSGSVGSRIEPLGEPDAVLCRGNADSMQEVLGFLERGVPVALAGGGDALERIANAALELQAGRRTSHPELFLFNSWGEVQDYVEHDKAGQDLKAIVKLVDDHGPQPILKAVAQLSPEGDARVTVSTVHKAKGREWDTVRVGEGFSLPPVTDEGRQLPMRPDEARLVYVAVTRARHQLDVRGLSWVGGYEKAMAIEERDGTIGGVPMIHLSLTGQLQYTTSPMSRFMAEYLPGSGAVVSDYQRRISRLPHPVQPVDVQYPDWPALGHAIDYRLRLSLGQPLGEAVELGVRGTGLGQLLAGAPGADGRMSLHRAGLELLAEVGGYLADPSQADDERLSRLCFVAAHFEDVFRSGRFRRQNPLAGATGTTTLDLLCADVPPYVVEDLRRQMNLAEEPFKAFRSLPPEDRICGPVFAGSADIGGADADFIVDGLLLDCKASTRPQRLGRDEIYQLAGYLLLDYDDDYGIDRVGLYLSRQGHLVVWGVDEFLARLGARTSLTGLRGRLRTHLRAAARTVG
ncbi:UvrD-helicase domain-containing protein [Kitasatospora sp. NPDC096077]|uniref:UvrD-helicase domain-containing protein n=1 Tax=Kitasatospora sp. NPDC096077 TaxID=3155544 RepID=UPI00331B6858